MTQNLKIYKKDIKKMNSECLRIPIHPTKIFKMIWNTKVQFFVYSFHLYFYILDHCNYQWFICCGIFVFVFIFTYSNFVCNVDVDVQYILNKTETNELKP